MKWFLIAMVVLPLTNEKQLKINQALKFDSFEECNVYYEANKKGLAKGLLQVFPDVKLLDMSCIDVDTANEMQEELRKQSPSSI